eukprot:Hpha_TRINITY_DN34515_c0_g1::TRINITY_DN34515_c0_g1_i1::g.96337::m.96337
MRAGSSKKGVKPGRQDRLPIYLLVLCCLTVSLFAWAQSSGYAFSFSLWRFVSGRRPRTLPPTPAPIPRPGTNPSSAHPPPAEPPPVEVNISLIPLRNTYIDPVPEPPFGCQHPVRDYHMDLCPGQAVCSAIKPSAQECTPLPPDKAIALVSVVAAKDNMKFTKTGPPESGVVSHSLRTSHRRQRCAAAFALRCAAQCECSGLVHTFASGFMSWSQEDQLISFRCSLLDTEFTMPPAGERSLTEWLSKGKHECCQIWDPVRRWHNCSGDLGGTPWPGGRPKRLERLGPEGGLLMIGDSLTRAVHGRDPRLWSERHGGWKERLGMQHVVNLGLATEPSAGLLNRLWLILSVVRDTNDGKGVTVFLMTGTNDVLIDGARSVSIAYRNIDVLISALRIALPRAKIVVQSVPPVHNRATKVDPISFRSAALALNSEIARAVGKAQRKLKLQGVQGVATCFLNTAVKLFRFRSTDTNPDGTLFMDDGIHLTDEAYSRWSSLLKRELDAGPADCLEPIVPTLNEQFFVVDPKKQRSKVRVPSVGTDTMGYAMRLRKMREKGGGRG